MACLAKLQARLIRHSRIFRGRSYLQFVYTDGAKELDSALSTFGFPHGTSTPDVHETNAHIERRNQTILGGTRTLLEYAGMPSCFWPMAARCLCHHLNIEKSDDGESAWYKIHK